MPPRCLSRRHGGPLDEAPDAVSWILVALETMKTHTQQRPRSRRIGGVSGDDGSTVKARSILNGVQVRLSVRNTKRRLVEMVDKRASLGQCG